MKAPSSSCPLFLQLLRYCIGTADAVPAALTPDRVREVFDMAGRQSLTAVMLEGVKRLEVEGDDGTMAEVMMDWCSEGLVISRTNERIDGHVAAVVRNFRKSGFECCLLKGQGNALMYPDGRLRTPGDIDLWLRTAAPAGGSTAAEREAAVRQDTRRIISYIRRFMPAAKAIYHHIECPAYQGTEVEIHYRPHFMFNFRHNRRLQEFFFAHADAQFAHEVELGGSRVAVPTARFNAVFQLSHIFQHLFKEGIGLRQLLDYYYLLTASEDLFHGSKAEWKGLFARLGLGGIAGAVMWILTEEFGMDSRYALVEPDARRGRLVLDEVLRGGNFGKYHVRRLGNGMVGRNLGRLIRDARLVRYFPVEALSEPVFRLWHAAWRWRHSPSRLPGERRLK